MIRSLLFVGILLLNSCANVIGSSSNRQPGTPGAPGSPGTPSDPNEVLPPPEKITGTYCVPSTINGKTNTEFFSLNCLQSDDSWKSFAVNTAPTLIPNAGYCEQPSLNQADDGVISAAYRCGSGVWYSEYSATEGWLAPLRVDQNSPYSPEFEFKGENPQFGVKLFTVGGVRSIAWTTSMLGPTFSRLQASTWVHRSGTNLAGAYQTGYFCRHTNYMVDNVSGAIYLHCAGEESSPHVYKLLNGVFTELPTISKWSATPRAALYTQMTMFQGNPCITYTDYEQNAAWHATTARSNVACLNGPQWDVLSEQLEDTPGHDAPSPYLFVTNQALHALYFDYTSTGMPPQYNIIRGRYRVKKWTGSAWLTLPGESTTVYYAQVPEYRFKNDKLLFAAVRYFENSWEKILVGWQDGQFQVIGNPIKKCATASDCNDRRPGAVIDGLDQAPTPTMMLPGPSRVRGEQSAG